MVDGVDGDLGQVETPSLPVPNQTAMARAMSPGKSCADVDPCHSSGDWGQGDIDGMNGDLGQGDTPALPVPNQPSFLRASLTALSPLARQPLRDIVGFFGYNTTTGQYAV